ncbi:DUF3267 domain-containing protein [Halorhabdus sp. CBA1104]|uniref:DUF3267 domain-containing protein n=1 Tax=Halorhabdus sp. CBA1104 TaxID=1380432 RepID=UPI0012B40E53|nr:DUF3267 domain-containing protein [Halorhabdus sp. CBA1104]QGN05864.1 DUF3267 domain-containing protein [Halorhabdus sp. CBA1104]
MNPISLGTNRFSHHTLTFAKGKRSIKTTIIITIQPEVIEYMTSNTDVPSPPKGHEQPVAYQTSLWKRAILVICFFSISVVIYSPPIRNILLADQITLLKAVVSNPLEVILGGSVMAVLTVIPHEYSHKFVASSLGYPAQVNWKPLQKLNEPYNFIPGNWIDAKEYNIILLSPLLIVNVIASALVIAEIAPLVNYIATAMLVFNTAMSSDDIWMVLTDIANSDSAKIAHQIEDGSLVVYRSSRFS